MDIFDLIYYNKRNPNFIDDFTEYLTNRSDLAVLRFTNYNDIRLEIVISIPLTKEKALELFDSNTELTMFDYASRDFDIDNLLIVKKIMSKVVEESDFIPTIERYSLEFFYDIKSRELDFFCSFTLILNK